MTTSIRALFDKLESQIPQIEPKERLGFLQGYFEERYWELRGELESKGVRFFEEGFPQDVIGSQTINYDIYNYLSEIIYCIRFLSNSQITDTENLESQMEVIETLNEIIKS